MFPSNFLTDLARKYELSSEQEEVFLLWWGNGKDDREISEQLHVTAEAIRNRKTGIYKKFNIAGTGANKANKLRNWLEAEAKKQNVKAELQPDDDLDLLVQDVKQKIAADVTDRCGTMRVLDMTQPVDLDRIYTDVNIIKEVIGRRRIGYDEVMEVCTREHFDRFLVGTIKERVTGLKAVDEIQKLVVLGKPGAGKTTFMKYLAMSCLAGKFHGELVPIFVTLKAYAEERGQPSLENYILTEFEKRKVSQDVAKQLLDNGKALILLDGLDEVKKEDDRRVKQDIDQFSRDWLKNRFAITCRIAAREYQFEKFTEVEVADFDDGQIETFVNNWFRERDESKAERMLDRLKGNEPVKELAKSPLLLTLLCLVFGERNDFPPKRSELYREGLEVLMKKWDAKRNIEREIIYKHLSPQNKEDMLGQIAFNTFLNGEYFFRQEDLQRQIKDYICNLPEASADPDALRLDSEVVLKAIEHHHGLLVERARYIYSFSHLTFQEYFAAREIERERHFENLIENISNPRWKEVFYLTAEMLRRSDDLVKMMKERIDGMLRDDVNLQVFLEWLKKKTDSVQTNYKITGMRAYYTYLGLHSFVHYLESNPQVRRTRNRAHAHFLSLKEVLQVSRDFAFVIDSKLSHDINFDSISIIENDLILDRDLSRNLVRDYNVEIASSLKLNVLVNVLQKLKDKSLPIEHVDSQLVSKYWKSNGEEWNQELHQICIDCRNIGHDWQFTKEQAKLLKQYYAANLFLVECMNRSYVSKQVREEIEATMLLPSKK
ncbi:MULTISPECIES: NACHT C-terminal helical domain 2-containing protein [Pseudanabaena]|jgi:predicted NACHT family NTPase|uniref:NACHT C-terminal helical domain 2-containing protein n=1 Tax=Pseudanabaena TaxID=1152 RepID=UPI002479A47B|nr:MULTISPECIES: NACHT domain-containing protein [Pseudanabaena]MEA5485906.1 NACHT domain-containing protein [Pseudanabaena sp. CCNP1317]WGS71325.1 NACHT domain-containing protein [Pseudanabaena galeata CCNP1313]